MHFDYIFCGYGLSALLVLENLAADQDFGSKKILVVSKGSDEPKTWCFWEKGPGPFDKLLTRQWPKALFRSGGTLEILQGQNWYKMLEPSILEVHMTKILSAFPNVTFVEAEVIQVKDRVDSVKVITDKGVYMGAKAFDSIYRKSVEDPRYPMLLQHFAGWTIETTEPSFEPDTVTFMDFDIPQENSTRFVYVLPFSDRKALVEYTVFSPSPLEDAEYEQGIRAYLAQKNISGYRIEAKESGVIPMTAYPFWKRNTRNVLHIGTAGGWTKPSTGYTLMYAQRKARQLREFLDRPNPDFSLFHTSTRFAWFDRIFVSVLYYENQAGKHIFSTLFRRAKPALVLRFLREETSFVQDLALLWSCPKRLFVKHLFHRVFRSFFRSRDSAQA